jgi:hypothetical protein
MRILLASTLAFGLLACSGPAKKKPDGPAADDVPQEVTCCITPSADDSVPEKRDVVSLDNCPEEQRNPVDQCNIGPGENEPSM